MDDFDASELFRQAVFSGELNRRLQAMASTEQFVFIDGTFEELAQELADHLSIDVKSLLAENKKDEALKKIVTASPALNSMPEKEFSAAYNLLIYLVLKSPNVNMFLPKICENLSKPITSSPVNGNSLALNALTTVFNLLPSDSEVKFNVFQAILRVVKISGTFELLRPQLKDLGEWIIQWDVDEEDQRKLYQQIADVAEEAGEEEQSFDYLLKALRTFDSTDISSSEAQALSLRALKLALLSNTKFDFNDLNQVPAISALSDTNPVHSELLEIFLEKELEDYNDFCDEHDGFVEAEGYDHDKLHRKMRLLTMASLAASVKSREIEYKQIAKALQVPTEDVEMWVIDVIKAGLVEGKLSQQKKLFLVHRNTYRVFGERQWREVQGGINSWISTLRAVKANIAAQREAAELQQERDMRDLERQTAGMGVGRRGVNRDGMVEMGTD